MSRLIPHVSVRPRALTAVAAGALVSFALLGFPGTSTAAQPALAAPQTTVYYNPLDLATDRGTRALYQRIVRAAQTVCPSYDPRDLNAWDQSRECQRQAVARAITQVGDARLAALYTRTVRRHG